tara:strand:- start:198 stop:1064 length:867 start_codon:yes stop_codon:yes gene_type:complete
MDNIVGLGSCGCNIAREFAVYPQYSVYGIDSQAQDLEKFMKVAHRKSHEAYEEKFPVTRAKKFFKDIGDDVLVVVGGGGTISGAVLRVLEVLKDKNVSVMYIRPDVQLLSYIKAMQERLTYSVLQEFARSKLINRVYLVDNLKLEDIVGDVPLKTYYKQLNSLLVPAFHMVNVLNHSQPIINTFSEPNVTANIATLGISDLEEGEERSFFDMEYERESVYYYAINNDSLQSDGALFKKIRQQIRQKSSEDEQKTCSYGIFATNYDTNYVYFIKYATLVQGQIILEPPP